jgi:UDP:flavonoid glycosyltransferase YjiC (YdhE family)
LAGIPLCDENAKTCTEINLLSQLPVKLTTKDLPWLIGDSASCKSRFHFWLKTIDQARTLKCILNNSFPAEEGKISEHFQNDAENSPHVLQVGPLFRYNNSKCTNPIMWEIDSTCIKWLDLQGEKSVIYVSFGTWVGPIGSDKIKELALGLENSERQFLWVLKKEHAWQCGLPEGFLDRIEGRGKIVEWAPQEEVLKHKSIGLYITHCGWNSTMEAIQHAKPLLCYPISGDQFINCSYIVNVWGIGIKLDRMEQKAVQDCVEMAMEGEKGQDMLTKVIELRRNAMEGSASEKARSNLKIFVDSLKIQACIC